MNRVSETQLQVGEKFQLTNLGGGGAVYGGEWRFTCAVQNKNTVTAYSKI